MITINPDTGVLSVNLGSGRVVVSAGRVKTVGEHHLKKQWALRFAMLQEAHVPGEDLLEKWRDSEEQGPPVLVVFETLLSLDNMIKALGTIRTRMTGEVKES